MKHCSIYVFNKNIIITVNLNDINVTQNIVQILNTPKKLKSRIIHFRALLDMAPGTLPPLTNPTHCNGPASDRPSQFSGLGSGGFKILFYFNPNHRWTWGTWGRLPPQKF